MHKKMRHRFVRIDAFIGFSKREKVKDKSRSPALRDKLREDTDRSVSVERLKNAGPFEP